MPNTQPEKLREEFFKDSWVGEVYDLEMNPLTDQQKREDIADWWLAKLLASREEVKREYQDALIWCSGSDDFQIEGKAREGWEKICLPLLKP